MPLSRMELRSRDTRCSMRAARTRPIVGARFAKRRLSMASVTVIYGQTTTHAPTRTPTPPSTPAPSSAAPTTGTGTDTVRRPRRHRSRRCPRDSTGTRTARTGPKCPRQLRRPPFRFRRRRRRRRPVRPPARRLPCRLPCRAMCRLPCRPRPRARHRPSNPARHRARSRQSLRRRPRRT